MTKVAPPAFASGNDASQWLIFVGATTTTPLGQVKTFSFTQEKVRDEQMRVSDSKTYYTNKGVKYSGTLELWQGATSAEVLSVGGKALTVDDAGVTLIAVLHTAEATSGTAVDTFTFTNFQVVTSDAGPREGQSSGYWACSWTADSLTVA